MMNYLRYLFIICCAGLIMPVTSPMLAQSSNTNDEDSTTQESSNSNGGYSPSHPGPEHTEPGGSRDGCPPVEIKAIALAPTLDHQLRHTTEARPTLWVYMPYTLNIDDSDAPHPSMRIAHSARLDVERITQGVGNTRRRLREYRTIVTQSLEHPGIIGLTLPDAVPELPLNEELRWKLSIFCHNRTARGQASVPLTGLIKRVSSETISEDERWYDHLTQLSNAIRNGSATEEEKQQWVNLLQQVEDSAALLQQLNETNSIEQNLQNCCTLTPPE